MGQLNRTNTNSYNVVYHWYHPALKSYYQVQLCHDEKSGWKLVKLWGTMGNDLSNNQKSLLCHSYHDGLKQIHMLEKMHKQRGYTLIVMQS